MVTPTEKRAVVAYLVEMHQVSQRRVCQVLVVPRRWLGYQSKKNDRQLCLRLKALALERRRFGYRRLAILLKREGEHHNLKKIYRLYKEEGLMVKRRKGRKRALGI